MSIYPKRTPLVTQAMAPIHNLIAASHPVSEVTPQEMAGLSLVLLGGLGAMITGHTLAAIVHHAEQLVHTHTICSVYLECVVLDPTSTTNCRAISVYDLEMLIEDFECEDGYGLTYHDYVSLVSEFSDGTITAEKLIKILLDK